MDDLMSKPTTEHHTLPNPTISEKGHQMHPPASHQNRSGRSLKPVIWAGLVVATVFVGTHLVPFPGGKKAVTGAITSGRLFDQSPSFNGTEVLERIAGFGEEGRAAYQLMTYTSDLVFPLAILVLLLLVARHLMLGKRSMQIARGAALLAGAFFAADMVENATIYHLLAVFPEGSALAPILGFVTVAKFAFLAAAVLALIVSAAVNAAARARAGTPASLA